MFGADKGDTVGNKLDGKKLYIGIVRSRFNDNITSEMLRCCVDELHQLGVNDKHITVLDVPGALEIPVALQALADQQEFDALIALGCIIRGETYHFEVVADQMAAGIQRVSLDFKLPIANEVLTVENVHQALARRDDKARDAARVAVEMANLLNELA
jgi:6,7-dimethyl-8-ribityllumazine synthase